LAHGNDRSQVDVCLRKGLLIIHHAGRGRAHKIRVGADDAAKLGNILCTPSSDHIGLPSITATVICDQKGEVGAGHRSRTVEHAIIPLGGSANQSRVIEVEWVSHRDEDPGINTVVKRQVMDCPDLNWRRPMHIE